MPTFDDYIERVRHSVYGATRFELNLLSSPMDNVTTTVSFTDPARGIVTGAVLGVDTELMYVRSTDGQTATVIRGYQGTTPAVHAQNAIIEVNARFPRARILEQLVAEIQSWSKRMFRVGSFTLGVTGSTASAIAQRGFDLPSLPAGFYSVLDVRRTSYDPVVATMPRVKRWEVKRNLPTTLYPSGVALFLKEQLLDTSTLDVIYSYGFNLTTTTGATDLVSTVGLTSSMLDIVELGAQWRLMTGQIAVRSNLSVQLESRESQDVPAGAMERSVATLKQLRDSRLAEEEQRLMEAYPVRWTS